MRLYTEEEGSKQEKKEKEIEHGYGKISAEQYSGCKWRIKIEKKTNLMLPLVPAHDAR